MQTLNIPKSGTNGTDTEIEVYLQTTERGENLAIFTAASKILHEWLVAVKAPPGRYSFYPEGKQRQADNFEFKCVGYTDYMFRIRIKSVSGHVAWNYAVRVPPLVTVHAVYDSLMERWRVIRRTRHKELKRKAAEEREALKKQQVKKIDQSVTAQEFVEEPEVAVQVPESSLTTAELLNRFRAKLEAAESLSQRMEDRKKARAALDAEREALEAELAAINVKMDNLDEREMAWLSEDEEANKSEQFLQQALQLLEGQA